MSPIMQPDFADVKAGFRTLDRSEVEVVLGKPRGFFYVKDDGTEVGGVRIPLTCVGTVNADGSIDDQYAGDSLSPVRLYLHTEGSARMTKQFLLAAAGYAPEDEDTANDELFSSGDFSFDVEESNDDGQAEVTLGKAWLDLEGNHARVTADIEMYEGKPQQTWKGWLPI